MFFSDISSIQCLKLRYCHDLIPKHSFCNTVCVCMVMQIKLVVVGRPVAGADQKSLKRWRGHLAAIQLLLIPLRIL